MGSIDHFPTITMESSEKELEVLHRIYHSQDKVRQRDLAHVVGLSLGMTNAILKRLAKKGLIKVKKINNRNIQYVVSPAGVEAIARRSYRYFKRTIKNVAYYKESIEELVKQIASDEYTHIILVGESDLDFIVEHLCLKYGLEFRRKEHKGDNPTHFFLFSENLFDSGHGTTEPQSNLTAEERCNEARLFDIFAAPG